MKFEEACVLLPCHSLEDFPTHYEGPAAEGLLASWSALWHPRLLAACGRLPTWYRADGPPDALAGKLIVIPATSEPLLLAGWVARAEQEGAHVVRKLHQRSEIVAAALAGLDPSESDVPGELDDDFLALGYGYLAVELLTRQMRYMSNIDEVHLQNEALAAARASMTGDSETARRHLQNSFEVLIEARERFYPVDAFLVDLTLVAPTTVGDALRAQLAQDAPQNLLIAGETLKHLAQSAPESLAALRLGLDHKRVSVIGGERSEREAPLLPVEEVLADFRAGAAIYQELLGNVATVFGRRRYGLSPLLPQILSRSGFIGAVHATLDDGRFPTAAQAKVRWEGLDYAAIDALTRLPVDANRADTFLALPRTLGESMDRDHVATIVLAHWPGQASTFYRDLQRMAAYGAVLGKFITLDDYFAQTSSPGEIVKLAADGYRSPYLVQAVQAKSARPISGLIEEHERDAQRQTLATLAMLGEVVTRTAPSELAAAPCDEAASTARHAADQEAIARRLAGALSGNSATGAGLLVVNPESFSRQMLIDATSLATLPAIDGAVTAAQDSHGAKLVIATVPGMGVCWIGAGPKTAPLKKAPTPIARENTLVNEHMRVEISRATGGVHAIYDNVHRGNRIALQIARRTPPPRPKPGDVWRDPDDGAVYSTMVAETLEIGRNGTALGEIISRGQLLDDAQRPLARFVQTYQLARGARVVHIETVLEINEPVTGEPWDSYIAARVAWPDDAADLYRNIGLARQPTNARRLEATKGIEIRTARTRTAILTAGLPYHRRCGERMLDTLLVVQGEARRQFRYALGVELSHPMQQAIELTSPPVVVLGAPRPASPQPVLWLFQIDSKHVVATHWESQSTDGGVTGFRVRLAETDRLAGRVTLRALRDLESAQLVDFHGQALAELPVTGDSVTIDIAPLEWVEVAARFRS